MKKVIFIVLVVSLSLAGCSSGGGSGSSDSGGGSGSPTAKWYVAKGAPSNAQGVDGDLYLDQDAAVLYVKTGGQWVTAASLRGAAGTGWLFGSGAPGSSLGADGDLYLDTASTMTYRKYGGTWTSMFTLQGAAGAAWYTGTADPTSGVPAAAKAGDFYLNIQTSVIWKKDGSGNWSSLVMFQAAANPQFAFTPEMENNSAQYFNAIAFGNGKFVAVGIYGTIAVSSNGTSWTLANHYPNYSKISKKSGSIRKGLVEDLGSQVVESHLNDIAYGNGVFVAVGTPNDYGDGDYASVYTSSNGTTWNFSTSIANQEWMNVAFANGLFFAAVDNFGDRLLYTSPNGTAWTQQTLPLQCDYLSNTVYGNGKFLVVGNYGGEHHILTSANGVNWVEESGIYFEDDCMSVSRIAYGNGVFVAVGDNGSEAPAMWNSVDGIAWNSVELPIEQVGAYDAVSFGNGFVVLGYTDYETRLLLTSSNGISWAYNAWPSRYYFTDAAWGPLNGGTIAVTRGEYYNP